MIVVGRAREQPIAVPGPDAARATGALVRRRF